MLDYFCIFTKGGALLWTLQFAALKHSPAEAVNALIRSCLLEERSGENIFTYIPKSGAAQSLKWTFHNGLGLVFVAVYQKTLSLLYVDELLQRVKQEFVPKYKPNIYDYSGEFDDVFKKLLNDCESQAEAAKRGLGSKPAPNTIQVNVRSGVAPRGATAARSSSQKAKGGSSDDSEPAANGAKANGAANGKLLANGKAAAAAPVAVSKGSYMDSATSATSDEDNNGVGAFDVSKISKKNLASRGSKGRTVAKKEEKPPVKKEEPAPRKKAPRRWDMGGKDEPKAPIKLDYSEAQDAEDEAVTGASSDEASAGEDFPPMQSHMDDIEEEYEDEEEIAEIEREFKSGKGPTGANGTTRKSSVLGSFMSRLALNVVGSSALTQADIKPALVEMKKKLMERNVAEAIAEKVCSSVGAGLEGKKLSSFTGLSTFVKSAFEEALSGILNKRQADVLLDIQAARARGKPFVIVFCGVNGVGKSTNLAKICYWLLQHGCKPMIAACDTFRAGAVEQLKTHCTRLKVPLYERGYEKDPAKVASEAIKQAARDGRDVVLVDTAGRMQDNEPLMRALSNLINLNNPNLVLFVGEALVGNDAVDQLVKFNRALYDLSPVNAVRRHAIDGIVLTKFDTIDDKVGAAVSMVYASGAPVMFVGCGQTYVDLKKLNVKSVVKALLS